MVGLTGAFCRLKAGRVLVVGDLMLDAYTFGKVERVSPEAPVPVLHVTQKESRAGGAGNVALNLRSLGTEVAVFGRVGMDEEGRTLRAELEKDDCFCEGILEQKAYPTCVKNRIMAGSQQLVRVDREQLTPLSGVLEQEAVRLLPEMLQGVDIIAISDYDKGFLTRSLLRVLIAEARARDIPVIVDPKGRDFSKYHGATLVKPNEGEAYTASGLGKGADLDCVAQQLLAAHDFGSLMITRSAKGIAVFQRPCERTDFPVRAREVVDVTGAGDTVLAVLTVALASGLSLQEGAELCNVAASIAIEQIGCARITRSQLGQRLLELHSEHKVFGLEQLRALAHAAGPQGTSLLVVSEEEGFSAALFSSLETLRTKGQGPLVVAVLGASPESAFVQLLSSLRQVDFVVLGARNGAEVAHVLQPGLQMACGDRSQAARSG